MIRRAESRKATTTLTLLGETIGCVKLPVHVKSQIVKKTSHLDFLTNN